jgi:hypothetical protein
MDGGVRKAGVSLDTREESELERSFSLLVRLRFTLDTDPHSWPNSPASGAH